MSSDDSAIVEAKIDGWYDLGKRLPDDVGSDIDSISIRLPKKWQEIDPGLAADLATIARSRNDLRRELNGYVYFLLAREVGRIKIGKATSLDDRTRAIGGMSPCRLELLGHVIGYSQTERLLHKLFAADRLHGEWFTFTDDIQKYVAEHHGRPAIASLGAEATESLGRVKRVAELLCELYQQPQTVDSDNDNESEDSAVCP